jgi:anti-anti-sigma factor
MTRPPAFRIVTERTGVMAHIALHGELDLATAPQLEAELQDLLHGNGEPLEQVVLDLRDLLFLDSTGLEVIVQLDAAGRRAGFTLTLVRGPRAVERLFSIMQLDRTLRLVNDPNEV